VPFANLLVDERYKSFAEQDDLYDQERTQKPQEITKEQNTKEQNQSDMVVVDRFSDSDKLSCVVVTLHVL
jgi:hypothetical protein